MAAQKILYLDYRKSRLVNKTLEKQGKVHFAHDINDALLLMAENDFDYYFVDADTPQAQAFLKHLQHDPQLKPPSAVVLLTDNEEEDCEAWGVDTFVTKSRARDDVPYVFSHLKGQPLEQASVVHILSSDRYGTGPSPGRPGDERRHVPGEPKDVRVLDTDPEAKLSRRGMVAEESRKRSKPVQEKSFTGRKNSGRWRLAAVAFFLLALGLWLFAWGPLSGQTTRQRDKPARRESVKAKSPTAPDEKKEPVRAEGPAGPASNTQSVSTTPVEPPSSGTAPAAEASEKTTEPAPAAQPDPPVQTPTPKAVEQPSPPAPAPAPQPVNHSPSVHVSGPTLVQSGQVVTFTASGSDPDGDSLSYSPGQSVTKCWKVPGSYTVTITVTDSHGESASGSINVTVRN